MHSRNDQHFIRRRNDNDLTNEVGSLSIVFLFDPAVASISNYSSRECVSFDLGRQSFDTVLFLCLIVDGILKGHDKMRSGAVRHWSVLIT